MPGDIRARLIRPAALAAFNNKAEKQSWLITAYRAGSTEITDAWRYQDLIDALSGMTQTYHRLDEDGLMPDLYVSVYPSARQIRFAYGELEPEARYPSHKRPEIFLCDPSPSSRLGSQQVVLPDLPPEADGKFIIVVFDRKIKDHPQEPVDSEPKAGDINKAGSKKAPKKTTRKMGDANLQPVSSSRGVTVDPVRLAPWEWAVFRKKGSHWEMEFKSVRLGEELITNPLLRESGPLVVNRQNVLQTHENDGELYLNKIMLTHLYDKKVTKASENLTEDEKTAVLPWHYLTTLQSFEPLKRSGNRFHFFLERPNSGHTVGVYVNAAAADNDVHIYLHETEGAAESTSKLIRQTLIKKMKQLYPEKHIKLFYPEPVLQRDFASCGVFAFKAMSYFRKHPEVMDQWLESMKANAMNDGDVGEVVIPMSELKPGLLKMYHYALEPHRPQDPRLTPAQRETVVNKKGETLAQYLGKFERQVPRLGRAGTTTINTGSLLLRYKMIDVYQSDIEQQQKSEAEADTVAGPSRKRKRVETEEPFQCPYPIVDSLNLPEINRWLSGVGDETIKESVK